MHGAPAKGITCQSCCSHMACCCRSMHAQRQACMQAACIASLLLALSACNAAAADSARLHDDRQLLQTQHAARHLLQGPGCTGPICLSGPAQTGPAQMAGPGGGGAGAGSPAARAVPSTSPAAASAAGAASSPGLSPDGALPLVAHHSETRLHALAAVLPVFPLCVSLRTCLFYVMACGS